MKANLLLSLSILLATGAAAWAATLYVDAGSANPVAPYTNWATAAAIIQAAVDAAAPGDEILVTNGTYEPIAVDIPIRLRSVNGPEVTSIDANYRGWCARLGSNAVLSGFTVTHGFIYPGDGAGVWCLDDSAMITNCAIRDNRANYTCLRSPAGMGCFGGLGGGVCGGTLYNCLLAGNSANLRGGAAYGARLFDCTLIGNDAPEGGGAAECLLFDCTFAGNAGSSGGGASASALNNCTLTNNVADGGGGAVLCTLSNCTLTGNWANDGGGASQCTLKYCVLTGNSAGFSGGGAIGGALNDCLLTDNRAGRYGGGAYGATLNNCTLTGNSASIPFGSGGGACSSALNDCIVYYNSAPRSENYDDSSRLNYCCTTPLPSDGAGNIVDAPAFADFAAGNLRLQTNSPCINAGNNATVANSTDLDGNSRIAGGTVDIGAYEFQSPTSVISYAWLQHFALPADGTADFADPDGDSFNTWQEWQYGTVPTNALSFPVRLLTPVKDGAHLIVSWVSATNHSYVLECSTNLSASPPFCPLATNIPGQPGTTTYSLTNTGGAGLFLFRVGAE
jgi:hypothetical protein